jgi:hypothetical protein
MSFHEPGLHGRQDPEQAVAHAVTISDHAILRSRGWPARSPGDTRFSDRRRRRGGSPARAPAPGDAPRLPCE